MKDNTDNLELFFKKRLKDESIVEDGWNVPSDDVWAKVIPLIQKTAGFFIPWKYFYISGIAIIGAITVGVLCLNKVDKDDNINADQGFLSNNQMEHVYYKPEKGFATSAGLANRKIKSVQIENKEPDNNKVTINRINATNAGSIKEITNQLEKPVYMKALSVKSIDYLPGSLKNQLSQKLRKSNFKFKTKDVPMPNFFW